MTSPEPPGEFQLFPEGPGLENDPKIDKKRPEMIQNTHPHNWKIRERSVLFFN